MVVLDCGEKRLGVARFVDKQEKHRGGRHAAIAFATLPAASCRNSPYSAIASPTGQADLRQGTSIDTRFL